MHARWGYKKNPFLYSRIYCDKKALLVQFGRTWVSKTQCRRFKSYRARFCSCCLRSKIKHNGTERIEQHSNLNLTLPRPPPRIKLNKGGGQLKKGMLINQRSNWSPRLYCKYAVTNNPAKVIGIKPKTIPNRKTSIIWIFFFERLKRGVISIPKY